MTLAKRKRKIKIIFCVWATAVTKWQFKHKKIEKVPKSAKCHFFCFFLKIIFFFVIANTIPNYKQKSNQHFSTNDRKKVVHILIFSIFWKKENLSMHGDLRKLQKKQKKAQAEPRVNLEQTCNQFPSSPNPQDSVWDAKGNGLFLKISCFVLFFY